MNAQVRGSSRLFRLTKRAAAKTRATNRRRKRYTCIRPLYRRISVSASVPVGGHAKDDHLHYGLKLVLSRRHHLLGSPYSLPTVEFHTDTRRKLTIIDRFQRYVIGIFVGVANSFHFKISMASFRTIRVTLVGWGSLGGRSAARSSLRLSFMARSTCPLRFTMAPTACFGGCVLNQPLAFHASSPQSRYHCLFCTRAA